MSMTRYEQNSVMVLWLFLALIFKQENKNTGNKLQSFMFYKITECIVTLKGRYNMYSVPYYKITRLSESKPDVKFFKKLPGSHSLPSFLNFSYSAGTSIRRSQVQMFLRSSKIYLKMYPVSLLHDIYRKKLYPLMVHPLTASSQVVW